MPKFLLLKHYNGGPTPLPGCVPMSEWSRADIAAHIAFQRRVAAELQESGEFVDAQALGPSGYYLRFDGVGADPVITDLENGKELIAGWFLVDVTSEQRARDIAAYVSSAPGRDGEPIHEWLEIRPIMDAPPEA